MKGNTLPPRKLIELLIVVGIFVLSYASFALEVVPRIVEGFGRAM